MHKNELILRLLALAEIDAEPIVCICADCDPSDPNWEPPIYATNPHALGCPRHRPTKMYCRIHHNGFYGHCNPCQVAAIVAQSAHPSADIVHQKEVIAKLVDELS